MMCEEFTMQSFDSFDEFIEQVRKTPLVVECVKLVNIGDMCCEVVSQPHTKQIKGLLRTKKDSTKKSVRFSDKIKEETFTEKRSDKIVPKRALEVDCDEDVPNPCPRYGGYLDDFDVRLEVINNITHNTSRKVNDLETKEYTKIVPNYQINQGKTKYYASIGSIPYITTCLLLGENEILKHITQEKIIDSILNMMEIYEHLETEDSMYTLDYKSGVSISNCVGKRQRGIIKKKVDYLTSIYL
jgi:hypothetical protein